MFFGRQGLVDSIVNHLRNNNFLAVIGPSGSGKSSLVLAGVLPELTKGALDRSAQWTYLPRLVPGSNPLRNLALACKPSNVDTNQWVNEQVKKLKDDPFHLAKMLREFSDMPVVIVVDQFEEIFTLCLDDDLRNAFVENLINIIRDPKQKHILIVTLRSDYEDRIVSLPELIPLFEKGRVRVTPLASADLYQAIEEPAKRVGLKFEDGVVDALVKDILGEAAGLPLLQFALLRLWKLRDHNRITWHAYKCLGGARRALALTADEFYERLFKEDKDVVKRILLRLARPGEGFEVTSNRVRRKNLDVAGDHPETVNRALRLLLEAGLVRLTRGEIPADDQVEVAHEALIRNWPELVGWLEDERVKLRKRLRLTSAADQWIELGRDPGALLAGSLLDEALEYKERNELSETEDEFVSASVAAIEAAEREKEEARERELELERAKVVAMTQKNELVMSYAKRTRLFAFVFALVALLAMFSAAIAAKQWIRAESSARKATASAEEEVKARQIAEEKTRIADDQSKLAEARRLDAEDKKEDLEKTAKALKTTNEKLRAESRRAKEAKAREIQALTELAERKTEEANKKAKQADENATMIAKAAILIAQAVILQKDGEALQMQGNVKDALGNYERALKVFVEVGLEDRAEETLNHMHDIYVKGGELAKAQDTKTQLENLPRSVARILRKTGAEKGITASVQEARALNKSQPKKYYYDEEELNNLGYELLNGNRVEDAIEVFKLNIEAFPNKANPYDSLGEAYMKAGNDGEALKYYKSALEVAIKTQDDYVGASSNYGLGQLSMKAGKKDEAREYYGKALELATKSGNGRVKTDATNALKKLGAT
jgi:tetratricopeptide (TPR) repeat protein